MGWLCYSEQSLSLQILSQGRTPATEAFCSGSRSEQMWVPVNESKMEASKSHQVAGGHDSQAQPCPPTIGVIPNGGLGE